MTSPEIPPIRVSLINERSGEHGVRAIVESLPKWRDATLVLAGVAYALGYLSWAIYASDHGWGLAPVLDAQYFTAGIFPVLIVIAACFVGWWLRWVSQWVRKPVSAFGTRVRSILEVAGTLSVLAGFILILVFKHTAPVSGALMIAIGGVAVIISSFLSREKVDSWYNRFVLGLAWVYLPLIGTLAFLFYTTKIFPDLPQAFGGPRPQRVQLDVDVSKVSPDTLRLLAPHWQSGQASQSIARSRIVYLVFQSRDYVFLWITDEALSSKSQPFRVQSSSVLSLLPVSDEQPH